MVLVPFSSSTLNYSMFEMACQAIFTLVHPASTLTVVKNVGGQRLEWLRDTRQPNVAKISSATSNY